jgi:hypothetical protein
MKIPKKFLTSAGKLFSKSARGRSKSKPTFSQLEGMRRSESSLKRGGKMHSDIHGNKHTLSANEELGRVNQWRRGETYAPGESSKIKYFK